MSLKFLTEKEKQNITKEDIEKSIKQYAKMKKSNAYKAKAKQKESEIAKLIIKDKQKGYDFDIQMTPDKEARRAYLGYCKIFNIEPNKEVLYSETYKIWDEIIYLEDKNMETRFGKKIRTIESEIVRNRVVTILHGLYDTLEADKLLKITNEVFDTIVSKAGDRKKLIRYYKSLSPKVAVIALK